MKSKNTNGHSRKGKSKKSRANNKSNVSKKQEKLINENFSEATLESRVKESGNSNIKSDKDPSQISNADNTESITEASGTGSTESTTTKASSNNTDEINEVNDCCAEIKAKQQELLNNLKNLSDAIGFITLTRDNVNSLRIEPLTQLYFIREVRPLVDSINLISWASVNMAGVAATIQGNVFADTKEIKNSLKLCYKINDEVDEILKALRRRMGLYIDQLDQADRNCPPFNDLGEDS